MNADFLEELSKKNCLTNYCNYGIYDELVKDQYIKIYTKSFTNSYILDQHTKWIHHILQDGIDNPIITKMMIEVEFEDNEIVLLTIFDYYINLIFWSLPVNIGDPITSEFLFFEKDFTKKSIKKYIDEKLLDRHRTEFSNIELNNIIDDSIYKFIYIDEFSMFFLNTINNEDTIQLMNENEEFNQCLHLDLSGAPLEEVKNIGMDYTKRAVDIIKNSDYHCLSDSFRAGEGINVKQFKEFMINIGTKPDGNGKIFNSIINSSYANGGLSSLTDFKIEGNTGRVAELYKKKNVGDSGHLSRLVGLNNTDTRIFPDPKYSCNTKNYIHITIKNSIMLDMYKNRWYKETPNGIEKKMSSNPIKYESHLIGKSLYFRSPMTCASHARGDGVCYKCYGDLAYTNSDINIGKIAAEIIWSKLTQMLLSAKHLLESMAKAIKWSDHFSDIFDMSFNIIQIKENLDNIKSYSLIIGQAESENEYDKTEYDEYILSFEVKTPYGIIPIRTEDNDNIYLSKELSELISNLEENEDGNYEIPFTLLEGMNLFLVNISNNELYHTLYSIKNTIDRVSEIDSRTKDQWIQELLERVIEGGLDVDAVHCEIILSNQIRSVDDILKKPQWEYPNEKYQLLTLRQALANHPNICVSLEHEKISKALYNPITFRKTAPSQFDLFFMERPQDEMDIQIVDSDTDEKEKSPIQLLTPIKDFDK